MTTFNVQRKILAQICLFIVCISYSLITVEGGRPTCTQYTHFTIEYPSNQEKKETCRICPICPPGHGLPIQCGQKVPNGTSTDCKPCPNGTYSKNNDSSECKSCDKCEGRNVLQQCTPWENSKCGTCLPGYYLDPQVDDCKQCFFCCDDVLEEDHLKQCKDLGMPWNMQCEATDANKKCKFKAILLNHTTASPITTDSPLSKRTGAIGSTGTAVAPRGITANNRTTARPITTVSPLSKRTGAIGSTGTALAPRGITANNRTTARPINTVSPLSKRTGAIGSTGTAIAPRGMTANNSTSKNASKLHPVPINKTEIINKSVGKNHGSSGGGRFTIAGLVAGGILIAIIAISCLVVKRWRQSGHRDQVYNGVGQDDRLHEMTEMRDLTNSVSHHQNYVNSGRTTLLLENQRTVRSAASMVNIGRTRPLLENQRTVSSAASSMVNIGRTTPLLENQRTVSSAAISRSMVNGSTTPLLLKYQSSDSYATSSIVNGRTTPLDKYQSTESSAASSMESLDAINYEETIGRDNLNPLRIPEALFVSDMEKLHYDNQVMFHSVQKKLDARETLQKKTWRGVGMALGVSSDDLDLIETCYISQQSPTEALVLRLKNRSCGEPSMREFVRALIKCERGDVARIIINWPRWEMTGDLVDSG